MARLEVGLTPLHGLHVTKATVRVPQLTRSGPRVPTFTIVNPRKPLDGVSALQRLLTANDIVKVLFGLVPYSLFPVGTSISLWPEY